MAFLRSAPSPTAQIRPDRYRLRIGDEFQVGHNHTQATICSAPQQQQSHSVKPLFVEAVKVSSWLLLRLQMGN